MNHDIAQSFATFLDANRFEKAATLLADDCTYVYSEGTYKEPKHIINIYKQHHLQSMKILDEMKYSSEVKQVSDNTFEILFTDNIRKGPLWHEYHSTQTITILNDKVIDIHHTEHPDELPALRAFYTKAMSIIGK
jgi:hypothetical protein